MEILYPYLLTVNALGFILMLADKLKAKKNRWRIPEAMLLGAALIGGSAGSLIGMCTFRHKTRHLKFTLSIPLILLMQILIISRVLS